MVGFGWIGHDGPFFVDVLLMSEDRIGRSGEKYSSQIPEGGIRSIGLTGPCFSYDREMYGQINPRYVLRHLTSLVLSSALDIVVKFHLFC